MKSRLLLCALSSAALCAAQAAAAAESFDFVGLGTLGGSFSSGLAINDAGQVVGYSYGPGNGYAHAFRWFGGTMEDLGTLGGSHSYASGINGAGQIAGYAYGPGNSYVSAVVWSGGGVAALGTLGGSQSIAQSINDAGQVAGYSHGPGDSYVHAFQWSNGTMTDLGTHGGSYSYAYGMNNLGQVTGNAYGPGNSYLHAFVWSGGAMVDLGTLGGTNSYGQSINDAGQVAGYSNVAGDSGYHATLWAGGGKTDLGTLGGSYSAAYGINGAGQIVGWAYTAGNAAQHAFLYDGGNLFDLNTLAPAGWTIRDARAINSFAQIAGTGIHNGVEEAFLLSLRDLHPAWQGGDGAWDTAGRWQFGALGSMQVAPSASHDVAIHPAASATVRGAAAATVRSLTIGGDSGRIVTFDLNGGSTGTTAGSTLQAQGVVTGNGRLDGGLAIDVGGRVWVRDGGAMQLGGSVANAGRIDLLARAGAASLEVGGALTNASGAQINLLNGDLFTYAGLANGGRVSLTGFSTLAGPVDNQPGGQINVADVAARAIFWDDLRNNGSVSVMEGSTASFLGLVTGTGSFTGGGTKHFVGGYSPGNGAAQTSLGGTVSFDGGAVTMEIGGALAGSGHDKSVFDGMVTIGAGMVLDVLWVDGYAGDRGVVYDLFDWNGGLYGQFATMNLPTLGKDLRWQTDRLYSDGEISITAVPELQTHALMLAGLGVLWLLAGRRARRV